MKKTHKKVETFKTKKMSGENEITKDKGNTIHDANLVIVLPSLHI